MSSKRTRRRNKEKRPLAESRSQITGQLQQSLQLPTRSTPTPVTRIESGKLFADLLAKENFPPKGLIGELSERKS